MLIWIYRKLGDLMFHLNGRLEGLNSNNRRERLMIWFWAKSYWMEEKVAGRIPSKVEG